MGKHWNLMRNNLQWKWNQTELKRIRLGPQWVKLLNGHSADGTREVIIGLRSLHVHEIIYLKGKHGYTGVSSRAAMKKKYYWKQRERDTYSSDSWPAAATPMAAPRRPIPCPSRPISPRSPSSQTTQLSPFPIDQSGPQPGPSPRAKTLCPFFFFQQAIIPFNMATNVLAQRSCTEGYHCAKKIVPCPFFIPYVKNAAYIIIVSAKPYIAIAWSDRMHWTCCIY